MDSTVTDDFSAKPCATWSRRARHHLLQTGRKFGKFVVHVFGLEIETGRKTVACR